MAKTMRKVRVVQAKEIKTVSEQETELGKTLEISQLTDEECPQAVRSLLEHIAGDGTYAIKYVSFEEERYTGAMGHGRLGYEGSDGIVAIGSPSWFNDLSSYILHIGCGDEPGLPSDIFDSMFQITWDNDGSLYVQSHHDIQDVFCREFNGSTLFDRIKDDYWIARAFIQALLRSPFAMSPRIYWLLDEAGFPGLDFEEQVGFETLQALVQSSIYPLEDADYPVAGGEYINQGE